MTMNKSDFILWFTCIYLFFFVWNNVFLSFSCNVTEWFWHIHWEVCRLPHSPTPHVVRAVFCRSRSALCSRGRGIYTRYFGQLRRPDQSDYVIVVSSSVEVKRITCRHGTARPQAISCIFWVRDSWLVESETSLHTTAHHNSCCLWFA
jgi:hypothetical protein